MCGHRIHVITVNSVSGDTFVDAGRSCHDFATISTMIHPVCGASL